MLNLGMIHGLYTMHGSVASGTRMFMSIKVGIMYFVCLTAPKPCVTPYKENGTHIKFIDLIVSESGRKLLFSEETNLDSDQI